MPLVTTKEMFRKAYEGGYAIGAFNVNNMEIVQAITEAAQLELGKAAKLFVVPILWNPQTKQMFPPAMTGNNRPERGLFHIFHRVFHMRKGKTVWKRCKTK